MRRITIPVEAEVYVGEILEFATDAELFDEANARGARMIADLSSLAEADKLDVERHLYPKWHSVAACQAAYDKAMGRA